ncbi:hypothetical protein BDK51DRAFT_27794 [Blyttiomyces helicus]|uniref:Uncharacterized protein n=1 Tax=Blyttiomyces helicus TaxID=388810 RepID=A0A4P9W9C0_9FUNG|nr:hypothetical protein BDK51DRAFT_27794 [Blyttiomyces helicus]|eukprot:RKO89151.1 hypothetical protein BDK51DRAFT_27794 [Blyttiomyces helicus]
MQIITFVAVALLATAALAAPGPQFGGNFGPGPVTQITVNRGEACSSSSSPKRVCRSPEFICRLNTDSTTDGVCVRNPAGIEQQRKDSGKDILLQKHKAPSPLHHTHSNKIKPIEPPRLHESTVRLAQPAISNMPRDEWFLVVANNFEVRQRIDHFREHIRRYSVPSEIHHSKSRRGRGEHLRDGIAPAIDEIAAPHRKPSTGKSTPGTEEFDRARSSWSRSGHPASREGRRAAKSSISSGSVTRGNVEEDDRRVGVSLTRQVLEIRRSSDRPDLGIKRAACVPLLERWADGLVDEPEGISRRMFDVDPQEAKTGDAALELHRFEFDLEPPDRQQQVEVPRESAEGAVHGLVEIEEILRPALSDPTTNRLSRSASSVGLNHSLQTSINRERFIRRSAPVKTSRRISGIVDPGMGGPLGATGTEGAVGGSILLENGDASSSAIDLVKCDEWGSHVDSYLICIELKENSQLLL